MDLVFLFFGLIFAILRVLLRIADDRSGSIIVKRHGTVDEFGEKYIDRELEKEITAMLDDETQYFKAWKIIENAYNENKVAISCGPERDRKIWEQLISSRHYPLGIYTNKFRRQHGFPESRGLFVKMAESVTRDRALHCLMGLKGKIPERQIFEEYNIRYNYNYKGIDDLANLDCAKWEESDGYK